jgi:signal transduction histidine kinase
MASITDMTRAREAEQRLHDLNRLYLTLARLNQATVRAGSAEELYAETCRIAVEEGGYLGAFFARPGPGAGIERLASAGALDGYIARLRPTLDPTSPRGHGPMARALRGNTPYYSDDFATDEATRPWQELAATFGVRAAAALPICCGGQVVAVFALWSERVHVFDEQARTLLESLARNVSFALDGFDAQQRLERAVAQRSELLHRLVAAQEDERTRIAAAVHDDSVQALASVDLRLGLLARRIRETAPELSPTVTQLQATVEAVSGGLRRLLVELEPVGEDVPLVEMLREAAGHVFENDDVRWSVVRDPGAGPDAGLAGPVLGLAVRITRDVLVDVRDRTDASWVVVTVRPAEDGVLVTVVDNGRGPGDPADDVALRRVRDRAEIAGGWCRVETRGTAAGLQCWLPRDVPGDPPG